ncbi:MAG: FeoB-associated Cys-rich membrane protein [Clostridiales bacterium]|nr:FeoB-associated Cys-rich membrane protein [Clostridiales bacterium]
MLDWLQANTGNIIILLILAVVVALVIRSMIKDKKSGKGSCGCNCGSCAMAGSCHSEPKKKE